MTKETEIDTAAESSSQARVEATDSVPTSRRPELVSVIVPTYDPEGLLERQLEALSAQDYSGRWEVVVVDNRSPTPVEPVVSRFKSRLPVRYVAAHDEAGISYARNSGADAARGDLLCFCDCDDEAMPGWVSGMVAAAAEADLVSGTNDRSKLNDPEKNYWHVLAQPPVGPAHGFMPIASGANMAIWRDVFEDVGRWDHHFDAGEDCDLSWRTILKGYRMVDATEPLLHYRFRPTLWSFMKQHYGRGTAEPRLFAAYREHGMPRSSPYMAMKTWASLVYRLPFAARSPRWRAIWGMRAAQAAGRLVGSLRTRVLYL